ncbi:acyl-CoA thioesterase domain-containing protein [Ottowia sp.]|uniref:acyl-CoA thioesterase n=1 Tax=Ottowia sp. TaxID=1898956 RepID=UPI00260C0D2E|nr:acyl-CoA thioesterase domain-containing protein [Ottowia sp.]
MSHLPWNKQNIEHLLELTEIGSGCWRTRHGDANLNGRSFGGQLLGQALMAGLADVPADRVATMMQFLFLQGAMPQEALDLRVTRLQDGKRFSSRHVRAEQVSGRVVLDAQVTCAVPLDAPSHGSFSSAPAGEVPEELARLSDVDPALLGGLRQLGGYSEDHKPSIEFRIPEPQRQFSPDTMDGCFRFWMRPVQTLPDGPHVHAAVFAYLSDWWVNFSALGLHLREMGKRQLYIASLNHAIWLHRPFRADQWLHVETTSPASASGRGLCVASVHDREGLSLATVTQECLMAYAD